MNLHKQPLLGIRVNSMSLNEAAQSIEQFVLRRQKAYVVEVNTDVLVRMEDDPLLRQITNEADLTLVDGQPLVWLSRLLRQPVRERVAGSDLTLRLCSLAAQKGYTLFLLGGREGVAEQAKSRLEQQYPGLQVVGTCAPPFGFEKDEQELRSIRQVISAVHPDIVLTCFGCPKQEKWIHSNYRKIDATVFLCGGGTIDFIAGMVKRAPAWVSRMGLEWFYRFCKEPKRLFKRYFIDDIRIVSLIFKYRKQHAA